MSRQQKRAMRRNGHGVTLKQIAEHVGLSPAAVSLVLNNAQRAASIPQHTRDRILQAARDLKYRPNFLARSLRNQRTYSVGVLIPEVSDGYSSHVLSGIEAGLLEAGYMFLVASHGHNRKLIQDYPPMLVERSIEGLIVVDTPYQQSLELPVVNVSGRCDREGVSNVLLDHNAAAEMGLRHLLGLGHRHIAFIRGQFFSADTQIRWTAIECTARRLRVTIRPKLVVDLQGQSPSPQTGYVATKELLETGERFTALFAFNDISAIGATRALHEAGLRVPQDVSVLGFDDIYAAAFHNPALTTIRQPLREMGKMAARLVIERITSAAKSARTVMLEPELIVRESTAQALGALAANAR
jgi:LacI family transcriptional regulator